MKNKGLIIIGGNSKLISEFLIIKQNNKYKKVIIISHRKYEGQTNYEILEFLEPELLINTIKEIMSDKDLEYDIIVSNTPPQNADFQNKKTLEWSNASLKLMNMISVNQFIGKIIFTGSCLPLLPFYHESFYKRLKETEMSTFVNLGSKKKRNLTYLILPPLIDKYKKNFNFLSDDYTKWAYILKEELGLSNSIVYPKGLVGIVTKILFFIKYKIL